MLRNNPTDWNTGIGTRYLITFKANATNHTIKFIDWGHICQTCTELILDDVKLYHWNASTDPLPCNGIAGITEPTENTITISPNPATNELTVNTNNNEQSTIIIYDLLSRKLMEQTFTNAVMLNIEWLAKGIYIYKVSFDTSTSSVQAELRMTGNVKGKIIKE